MSKRFIAVGVVLAVLVAVVVIVVTAPANWLARVVADRTGGHVLLADAQGTVWSGSAVLAFGGPGGDRLALPGRVTWALEITRTLAPVLHLTQDAVLLQPVDIRSEDGAVTIAGGGATVPTAILRLVGAPLNTLRPEGRAELRWKAMRWTTKGGALSGTGTLRVTDLVIALTPVRPLGTYRVDWTSGADGLAWTLATESGPLQLQGSGRVGAALQARVTASVARDAPAGMTPRLAPLLDAIGRRSPNEAVIAVGRS